MYYQVNMVSALIKENATTFDTKNDITIPESAFNIFNTLFDEGTMMYANKRNPIVNFRAFPKNIADPFVSDD